MAELYKTFMAEAEKLNPEGFAKAKVERAELEALRKDAERYRKLRAALGPGRFHIMTPRISVPFEPAQTYTQDGLDAALDALPAVGAA